MKVFCLEGGCFRAFKLTNVPNTLKTKIMEVKIKTENGIVAATAEIVDGVVVVSPKVEFEPKNGDVCSDGYFIYIFSCLTADWKIAKHCALSLEGAFSVGLSTGIGYWDESHRPATEEEKKLLFDKLVKEGWEWDAENMKLVKLKWKPKLDEKYYHPILRPEKDYIKFSVCLDNYRRTDFDEIVYKQGWAFKTEKECNALVDKLNEAIEGVEP